MTVKCKDGGDVREKRGMMKKMMMMKRGTFIADSKKR